VRGGGTPPNRPAGRRRYFASARIYATSSLTSFSLKRALKAGISPLPLRIWVASSSSVFFCTSGERRSFAFVDFPAGVFALPSLPWHGAQFWLNVGATSPAS